MKPIAFKESNVVYAEQQLEYQPLPAYRDDRQAISCWQLSWQERFRVLLTGKLWLRQLHFGQSLQPQLLEVNSPFIGE